MEQTFCSRIWRLGDNIDTDIIIMSKYLAKPSLREMVPHLFEPLRPELAARLRHGTRCGTSTVQAIPWRSSSSSTTPAHRTYAPETW